MKNYKDYWKSLLQGEQHIQILDSAKLIFQVILMIYFFHSILFYVNNNNILAIMSFITLILGIINLRLFNSNRFALSIVLMNIELLVTIIVTSLFLNFNSGFNLYALALIPFTYFVSFSLKKSKQYVLNPLPFTIASGIVFILSDLLNNIDLLSEAPLEKGVINLLYYSNMLGALFIIISTCSIYSRRSNTLRDSLEKENTRLDSFANIDVLTELHNRRYIETCLNTAYNRAHNDSCQFSILLCDLDNFKSINDTYGHLSGDKVLTDFSNILKSNIREFDCASRWGGEEFLIIVKGGIPIASLIAERISMAAANSLVQTENQEIKYTVTIGVASYKKGLSIEDLIEIADKNLYLGKHSGKNCYIC